MTEVVISILASMDRLDEGGVIMHRSVLTQPWVGVQKIEGFETKEVRGVAQYLVLMKKKKNNEKNIFLFEVFFRNTRG